jgi:hypothetical protein
LEARVVRGRTIGRGREAAAFLERYKHIVLEVVSLEKERTVGAEGSGGVWWCE